MILAIETSTKICSVALKTADEIIDERRSDSRGHHSERLFEYIEALKMKWSFSVDELDAVLISEGPGSYTGLRIGTSGVKGMLFGSSTPLYAVNTLAAMGWGMRSLLEEKKMVHAVIDARRKHLYHQHFEMDSEHFRPRSGADIVELAKVRKLVKTGHVVVGTGWDRLEIDEDEGISFYGEEYISAVSLLNMYEEPRLLEPFRIENTDQETRMVREVDPAAFDPRYITSKKPGT